jgi:cysteine desulfurase
MLLMLDLAGICASSGSACNAGSTQPSHVLTAIGTPLDLARGSLRLTLGAENTEAEIDYTLAARERIVHELRTHRPHGAAESPPAPAVVGSTA